MIYLSLLQCSNVEGVCPLRCDSLVSIFCYLFLFINLKVYYMEPQQYKIHLYFELLHTVTCALIYSIYIYIKELFWSFSKLCDITLSYNSFLCLLSCQDVECYVIDNNGFVLISRQRNNVSSHTYTHRNRDTLDGKLFSFWLDCSYVCQCSLQQGKKPTWNTKLVCALELRTYTSQMLNFFIFCQHCRHSVGQGPCPSNSLAKNSTQ